MGKLSRINNKCQQDLNNNDIVNENKNSVQEPKLNAADTNFLVDEACCTDEHDEEANFRSKQRESLVRDVESLSSSSSSTQNCDKNNDNNDIGIIKHHDKQQHADHNDECLLHSQHNSDPLLNQVIGVSINEARINNDSSPHRDFDEIDECPYTLIQDRPHKSQVDENCSDKPRDNDIQKDDCPPYQFLYPSDCPEKRRHTQQQDIKTDTTTDRIIDLFVDDSSNIDDPLPQRNLCLPDVDDMSMNRVFAYVEFYHQDLLWSFLSDVCFIVGSIAYVILSLWDLFIDDDEAVQGIWYTILYTFAPLVYVFNSMIDTEWALRIKKRNDVKRKMQKGWNEWRAKVVVLQDETKSEEMSFIPEVLSTTSSFWKSELRKHAAHRRDLLAALTFGIAALLALVATFLERGRDELENASDHVYVLSAVIAITGKRARPWLQSELSADSNTFFWNSPEKLEDSGDLLFFVGCVIDAVLGDFHLTAPIVSIFSSSLWLIDACLYLRSDIIRSGQLRVQAEDPKYLI